MSFTSQSGNLLVMPNKTERLRGHWSAAEKIVGMRATIRNRKNDQEIDRKVSRVRLTPKEQMKASDPKVCRSERAMPLV